MEELYYKYKNEIQDLCEKITLNEYLGRYEKLSILTTITLLFFDLMDDVVTELGFEEELHRISDMVNETTENGKANQLPWQNL